MNSSAVPISIVIPLFNEEESLRELYAELSDVAAENSYEMEIIFVDDGSRDSSWEIVEQLAADDERVRGIRFRRNFGKAAALNAGFDDARGANVFTLDADLQDDPHEMPRFLEAMDNSDGRGQRLEEGPSRSVAQGGTVASVQLAGRRDDRCPFARSQLRLQVLSSRDVRRSPAVRRDAPIRARSGGRSRLESRRDRRQPPGPATWTVPSMACGGSSKGSWIC